MTVFHPVARVLSPAGRRNRCRRLESGPARLHRRFLRSRVAFRIVAAFILVESHFPRRSALLTSQEPIYGDLAARRVRVGLGAFHECRQPS